MQSEPNKRCGPYVANGMNDVIWLEHIFYMNIQIRIHEYNNYKSIYRKFR